MSYQTGTATDAANLKGLIETFAQANGWTLTSGALTCSLGAVKLATEYLSGSVWQAIRIAAADDAAITVNVNTIPPALAIQTPGWPATYHLFAQSSPVPVLFCIVQYGVGMHQHLAFGGMIKYGSWGGGLWTSASIGWPHDNRIDYPMQVTADYSGSWSPIAHAGSILWRQELGGGYNRPCSQLRCDLDGETWTIKPSVVAALGNLHKRMPAAWNNQVQLLPYNLALPRPSNYWSLIGQIPHIRATRNDYLEPGDILTEGSDRWKVFPWVKRDAANRNGGLGHSGTLAVALYYDGP